MYRKSPLSALLLACLAAAISFAQEKSAAPAASPAQDFSKEAYAFERWYTRVRQEKDGTGTRERTVEVRMLSESGVKTFAVLSFPYTSANEVMEFDYIRVRKPNGTVVNTPDYNIQDMPGEVSRAAPLYSDLHEKHVAVKGLAVGDVLEYVARARVVKPQVPDNFWFEDWFSKAAIIRDLRLEIDVPSDKYVKVVSPDFKPEVKLEGARRIYRWTYANLEVKAADPNQPPRHTVPGPDVQVTTFASWEDVGRWYGDLQKEPLTVTPAIQAKAGELTKGLKSDDEKIHAIYNFVALKYHYIGLDFGIGRFQPHAADDVLDNNYGDCKDKHTLLAALLKASGIEAWPALIHSYRKLDPEVPSPAQFNHVITVVPRNGQFLWLDTTPEVAPYGLLLLTLRDKQALVIPVNGAPKLMKTPANPENPQRLDFSMEGKLSAEGTFTGHAEQVYEGDSAVSLRAAFRRVPESQWKDSVQRFSYAMNFGGEVRNVKVSPPDEIDKPFRISYDYVRNDFADWDNHHTSPALPPVGVEVTRGIREKRPDEPLLLGSVGKMEYHSRVQLPEGYRVVAPPRCDLIESYAEYHASTNIEDGVMTTTRELNIKKTEVPLSEWDGYRKFGTAIADDEFNPLPVDHTAAAVSEGDGSGKEAAGNAGKSANSNGEKLGTAELDRAFHDGSYALQQRDFQRAQESFEKVVAHDPKYPGAHFNLGVAMASRMDMSGAMEQFRKEEQVSPHDPRAYQIVAMYQTQMGKSDEAMEEWRKLLKADPENRTAASTLGGLLYQSGKYSEAVGVLETAVKAAPDSPSLLMQLGTAYLKTGDNDKALARLQEVVEQKKDDPMTLNNVSYTLAENKIKLDLAQKYGETALSQLEEEAQGAHSSPDVGLRVTYELSLVWDTLGWVYFQQGDAKRAENLVRYSWLLGEHDVVAEHLGEIYEKEGKTQQAAQMYQDALTVSSVPVSRFGISPSQSKASLSRAQELTARYEKLTGKKPGLYAIRRLPNGEWTQTPAEQLRRTREVKLANSKKLSGSAQFIVTLKPEKVESADYLSGDEGLEPLADKLKAAHYPLEFPPGSGVTLVLRVDVSCHATTPCIATLVPPVPVPATTQLPAPGY